MHMSEDLTKTHSLSFDSLIICKLLSETFLSFVFKKSKYHIIIKDLAYCLLNRQSSILNDQTVC